MSLIWTPSLAVGVESIDEQHRIWIEKANGLFQAGRERRAKEYIDSMLDYLDEYTKQHFKDEEAYMEEISYPDLDVQKEMHAMFIKDLEKLKKDYKESGGSLQVIVDANKIIVNWLIEHIRTMDKKIGEYAKTL